jgi:hypothetical protein
MVKTKTGKDLAYIDWNWDSQEDGTWSFSTISAAGVAETARRLGETNRLLSLLLDRMDSLGRDGLHKILREHAKRIRKAEQRRRAARKAKQAAR